MDSHLLAVSGVSTCFGSETKLNPNGAWWRVSATAHHDKKGDVACSPPRTRPKTLQHASETPTTYFYGSKHLLTYFYGSDHLPTYFYGSNNFRTTHPRRGNPLNPRP